MSTVAVVGPSDLLDGIAEVAREQPGTHVLPLGYDDEDELASLVTAHAANVDGWLFSDVVSYTRASATDNALFDRPASYVEHTGETLVQALVWLTQQGHDVAQLSIDTLPADDVEQTLLESGIPADDVVIWPYDPDASTADLIDFHHRHHRSRNGTTAAITCASSVARALEPTMPVLRLAPLAISVRIALRQLLLSISNQLREDAGVAIGMIQLAEGTTGLSSAAADVAGSLAKTSGGAHLLVTTRGPLIGDTAGLTRLPMLGRLADHHERVHIGLGLGDTAAEAENRARHALARARVLGDVRAVLALRDGTDMVLEVPATYETTQAPSLPLLAKRVGFSTETLQRLQELRESMGDEPITTRHVAEHLNVRLRTARRILHQLERAGLATRVGRRTTGSSGHPSTLYRLAI